MELMQLKMFRLVAEERSVKRAAKRVLRTQPAVSIALKKLEQELGAPLFDRLERRDYTLTQTGRLVYAYAVKMGELHAEALSALQLVTRHADRAPTRPAAEVASQQL
jgi:DNA-binding transcriptional LysR family regulator